MSVVWECYTKILQEDQYETSKNKCVTPIQQELVVSILYYGETNPLCIICLSSNICFNIEKVQQNVDTYGQYTHMN